MESLKLSELERRDQEPKIQTESQISPDRRILKCVYIKTIKNIKLLGFFRSFFQLCELINKHSVLCSWLLRRGAAS